MNEAAEPGRPRLLVIVGPTAVGKTHLAIQIAEQVQAEIISADTRYLYKGLDIGTAKPTLAERARATHHLIDVTTPDRPWSLAQYRDAAIELVERLNRRACLPMLVGGTGQYVRSILEGWSIPTGEADYGLRLALQREADGAGPLVLYGRLQSLDPAAAARLDPRNVRRVIRALEVILTSGHLFSHQRRSVPPNYQTMIIGLTLPRNVLYQRIDARIDRMLADGLVKEVSGLAAQGYGWSLPAMSAIGYRQIGMYLRGEVSLAEAIRLMRHATRLFVRRQANWFKADDPTIAWHDTQHLDVEGLITTIRRYFPDRRGLRPA